MIQDILHEARLMLQDVTAIAFSAGPGRFTGLRIGASVAQALAYAQNLPVIPVSTLAIVAQTAHREFNAESVLVVMDAHMKEVYGGAYTLGEQGLMVPLMEDVLCFPEKLKLPKEPIGLAVGDAFEKYSDVLKQICGEHVNEIKSFGIPQATDCVLLADALFQKGKTVQAHEAVPRYLRGADAWQKMGEQ